MSLGENIKKIRKEKGMTQAQLAKSANISRSYLADVESNRYNPSIDTLKNIAMSLGIQLNLLLSDDSEIKNASSELKLSDPVKTIAAHLEEKAEDITPHKMKMLKRYIDDLFDDFDE